MLASGLMAMILTMMLSGEEPPAAVDDTPVQVKESIEVTGRDSDLLEIADSAGVSVEDLGRISAALRVRHFGPRPLIEDGSVESGSSTLVNGSLGYDLGRGLRLRVEVFNLLDEEASDIDYLYESRLPGDGSGSSRRGRFLRGGLPRQR